MPSLCWRQITKLWNGNAGFGLVAWSCEKAFDKIEHGALFPVSTAKSIGDGYLDLLMAMCQDQIGAVRGSEEFCNPTWCTTRK